MTKIKKLHFVLSGVVSAAIMLGTCVFIYAEEIKEISESITSAVMPESASDTRINGFESAVYTNTRSGYLVRHPASWKIYEVPSMSYARIENIDARERDTLSTEEKSSYFRIEIIALSRDGMSLDEWVQRQNSSSVYAPPQVLGQKEMIVDEHRAIYQMEKIASGKTHPVVFIEKGDHVYLLNIASSYEKYPKVVDEIINSFKFTL